MDGQGRSHLFAYAPTPVSGQYLTLHYHRGTPEWKVQPFHEIVDHVPVQHVRLPVALTVRTRFEETCREWRRSLLEGLTN